MTRVTLGVTFSPSWPQKFSVNWPQTTRKAIQKIQSTHMLYSLFCYALDPQNNLWPKLLLEVKVKLFSSTIEDVLEKEEIATKPPSNI